MQNQSSNKTNSFGTPAKQRHILSKSGCWLILLSQTLLVRGLVGLDLIGNIFVVVLLSEMLLIFALRELIGANFARDMLDLTLYNVAYFAIMWAAYTFKLGFYSAMVANANRLADFTFMFFFIRILWAVKVPNSEVYYAWPIIGLIGAFFARRSAEPVVRHVGHSFLVYVLLILVFTYAFFGPVSPKSVDIKLTLAGLMGFGLFFKFFRNYMQSNIAMAEENIEHRSKEEQLAALIAAVLTKTEGKLDPELVEVMCLFSEMDESTQAAMAASIRDLHRRIVTGEVPSNKNKKPEDE